MSDQTLIVGPYFPESIELTLSGFLARDPEPAIDADWRVDWEVRRDAFLASLPPDIDLLEGVQMVKVGDRWRVERVEEQSPGSVDSEVVDDQPYTDEEREHVALARLHFEGREVVCPRCRQGIGKPCRQARRGYRELGPTRTHASVELGREYIGTHPERVALAKRLP